MQGWSFRKKGGLSRWRLGAVTVLGVPYSEHSSFADLTACVKALRPRRIVPTVNAPDAAAARAIVERFARCMDLSRDRSRLDAYFPRAAGRGGGGGGGGGGSSGKGSGGADGGDGGGGGGGDSKDGGDAGVSNSSGGKGDTPAPTAASPAAGAAVIVDDDAAALLDGVDAAAQAAALAEFERLQRLRRSVDAAKQQQRAAKKPRGSPAGSKGGTPLSKEAAMM